MSTGINPVPWRSSPLSDEAWTRLPEPGAVRALERVAARAYGAPDPAMVVAAPGTQILISLLPHLFPQECVAVLGPTYGEHAAAWGAAARPVTAWAALDTAAAVVCNPNNPDGRRVPPAAVADLAARLQLLVVDEAFADLEEVSVAPLLGPQSLVVLRSFGKTYGLAGLRLGFALAAPEVAARIRDALGPWAVSGPAVAIGREALGDRAFLAAAASRLDRDGARLDALLEAAECRIEGGTRLFRLARSDAAAAMFARLGQAGVLVRAFPDRPHLLRFGLPAPDAWDRLEAACLS